MAGKRKRKSTPKFDATPHYSGDKSRKFWDKINSHSEHNFEVWSVLVAMGCALQDIEGRMLRALEDAPATRRNP